MTFRDTVPMLKETVHNWSEDKAPRLAAALAYYTIFSIAPLVVIAIGIAGLALGEEAARGQISDQIRHVIGPLFRSAIRSAEVRRR